MFKERKTFLDYWTPAEPDMVWHYAAPDKCPNAGPPFFASNVVEECKKYCDRLKECNVIMTNGVECVVRKCETPVSKPQKAGPHLNWGPYPVKDGYDGSNGTLGYFPWIQGYCKHCYFAPENLKEALASMALKARTYKLIDTRCVFILIYH